MRIIAQHRSRGGVAAVLIAFFIVLGLFALVIGGCMVSGYNKAITLSEQVDSSWAQVENQLQRRYDLIPNLVATVKGYAEHEKEIFTDIAKSREKYFQAGGRSEKIKAATGIERALSRLLVLRERYPQLKAQANFRDLQAQLEGTENRIAVERKRYNDAVRVLNTYARGFFGRMFTAWAGVEPATYFETPEAAKEVPQVDFSGDEQPAAPAEP